MASNVTVPNQKLPDVGSVSEFITLAAALSKDDKITFAGNTYTVSLQKGHKQLAYHCEEPQGTPENSRARVTEISEYNKMLKARCPELFGYCSDNNTEKLMGLLKKGVNLNQVNPDGDTAVMVAAQYNSVACLRLLLDNKADPNFINEKQKVTALMHAAFCGHAACIRLLLQHNADYSYRNHLAMRQAASGGNVECLRQLLTVCPEQAEVALLNAAWEGRYECASVIMPLAINVNLLSDNETHSRTALLFAVSAGSSEFVRILLQNGADVGIKDNRGLTAVVVAARRGDSECLRLLLEQEKKIEPSIINEALTDAADRGCPVCVELLLKYGADVFTENKHGKKASQIAEIKKHQECRKLLIAAEANSKSIVQKSKDQAADKPSLPAAGKKTPKAKAGEVSDRVFDAIGDTDL